MPVARLQGARSSDRASATTNRRRRSRPEPGEVLVRVDAVGLCGSDTHWWETGGHRRHPAAVGRLGPRPRDRRDDRGRRRASCGSSSTRRSRAVRARPACPVREDLCPSTRFAGFGTTDGGLRDWMAWPRDLLVPIPDDLDPVEACQLEALGVALRAVDRARCRAGHAASRSSGPGPSACSSSVPVGRAAPRSCSPPTGWPTASMPPRVGRDVDLAGRRRSTRAGLDPVDVAIECAGTDGAVAHRARPGPARRARRPRRHPR